MGSVVIREYKQRFEADAAKGLLEDAQITCFLSSDDAGGSYPGVTFTSGYRILVLEEDVEAAEEALSVLGEYTPPKGMGFFRS